MAGKKTYIVLLKNSYLLFFSDKPKKKGHYTNDVKLFETQGATTCQDMLQWVTANHTSDLIKEVEDWE